MPQVRRGYKIRYYVSGKGKGGVEYKNYSLTVPSEIAENIPKDKQFIPRMTKEGLLFEPVDERTVELPDWATGEQNSNGSKEGEDDNSAEAA